MGCRTFGVSVCACVRVHVDIWIIYITICSLTIYSESLNYLFLSGVFFCIVINTRLSVLQVPRQACCEVSLICVSYNDTLNNVKCQKNSISLSIYFYPSARHLKYRQLLKSKQELEKSYRKLFGVLQSYALERKICTFRKSLLFLPFFSFLTEKCFPPQV